MKTSKKIKEAKGGILFVDEAYQLTQALQRGQSDFSGEAIDEMMKVMNPNPNPNPNSDPNPNPNRARPSTR